MMDLTRFVNLFITTFKSEQDETLTIFLPICRHEYIYVVPFKFNNVMKFFNVKVITWMAIVAITCGIWCAIIDWLL